MTTYFMPASRAIRTHDAGSNRSGSRTGSTFHRRRRDLLDVFEIHSWRAGSYTTQWINIERDSTNQSCRLNGRGPGIAHMAIPLSFADSRSAPGPGRPRNRCILPPQTPVNRARRKWAAPGILYNRPQARGCETRPSQRHLCRGIGNQSTIVHVGEVPWRKC